jgi:hypothetical protein
MMRIWMRALAAYRVPLIPADQLALVARRAFMRERRSHESPPYTRQMRIFTPRVTMHEYTERTTIQ